MTDATIPPHANTLNADLPDEEWRAIAGYEGLYAVSSLGRVRSFDRYAPVGYGRVALRRGRILKGRIVTGYEFVTLSDAAGGKTSILIHRLVADAFLPPDLSRAYVHHRDADRRNNRVENLVRCAFSLDVQRTSEAGRIRNGSTKLTAGDVDKIKERITSGQSLSSIARAHDVSVSTIMNIRRGARWRGTSVTAPVHGPITADAVARTDEIWRDIPGFVGLYQVSTLGQVRSLDMLVRNNPHGGMRLRKGRILKTKIPGHGYQMVSLSKGGRLTYRLVHRLVAETFLERPIGADTVNHRDFNKTNNAAWNLEWCNASANIGHSHQAGRIRSPMAKLTPDDVRAVRERIALGEPLAQIARAHGVRRSAISKIKNGTNWTHLT